MRTTLAALLLAAAPAALATASAAAIDPGPIPQGILPAAASPSAYRLDLTIVPDRPRFTGHAEIDVTLAAPASALYLHGRDLKVGSVSARVGGGTIHGRYAQVDPLGVSRVDFDGTLPAGPATLLFDYDAPFGTAGAGLYHIKVGDTWYAWTQFESIDARAAFPSFDQPGYKTPFTVTLTTKPGLATVSNAPETGTAPAAGGLVRHAFAATKPLPTYLVAFAVGPFVMAQGDAPPTPQRAAPMPIRIVATQPNKDKLDYAAKNSAPIVGLLEKYFGRPFPFPKLDQIASPEMGGAMENAGADMYADPLILLDRHAPVRQEQNFGMVVAHELSHQWFGDLVTPKWWDDIWLNESFANWMGYRIGNEWRPDLQIGVGAIDEALRAMNVDALKAGRPIHQAITSNGQIDGAFDQVTYGKGGQVVAMIAAYLGDEKFRDGVRLHLDRHAYGNASTDEFFASLAEAAHDPRVLAALKSFVDQQGVPVVRVERTRGGLALSQKRYALLGSQVPAETWTIPFCARIGATRECTLLDTPSATLATTASGSVMPNAGATGYYRFSLSEADWRALIADGAALPPGEALAMTDSLWAGFRAGEVSPALLVAAARAMTANPYSSAVTDGGSRLAGLRARGMIAGDDLPAYRALMGSLYAPKLTALGFDPKAGAFASDDPDRRKLRADLVNFVAGEARDPAVRAKLADAARAYMAGDSGALDPALLGIGLGAYMEAGGEAARARVFDKAATSEDTLFRGAAMDAIGGLGDMASGRWVIARLEDKRLRLSDKTALLFGMAEEPATIGLAVDWVNTHYGDLVRENGIFVASGLPGFGVRYCSVEKARALEASVRPKIAQYKQGALTLDRTVEQVNSCGVLEQAKAKEISAALKGG